MNDVQAPKIRMMRRDALASLAELLREVVFKKFEEGKANLTSIK